MALTTFRCNCLTPLHFKGLTRMAQNHCTQRLVMLHVLVNSEGDKSGEF